jgi:GT2 family glycosyltransferase
MMDKKKQSSTFRVSVVVPVHNRPELLKQSLSSFTSQDFALNDFEVLVCDDGSTEDLRSIVENFNKVIPNIRLLRQKPKGPAAARNLGIHESIGSTIIFLDSDVLLDRSLISHMVSAMDKNLEWMGAEASIKPVGGEDNPLWDAPVSNTGGRFHTAAIAYRRNALLLAGGFDETFTFSACEDVDLAARVLRYGDIGFVPKAIVYHPRRRVTLGTHWQWRKFWRYEIILAKRYGFLSFPGHPAGPFPRLRVASAAIVTLPAGRFIEGLKYIKRKPTDGMLTCFYAIFAVFCGLWALPSILFSDVPKQRNYLSKD